MKKTILSSLFPVAMLALGLGTAPVASGVDESFNFALGTPIPDGNPAGLSSDKVAGIDFSTSIVVISRAGHAGSVGVPVAAALRTASIRRCSASSAAT